MPPADGGLWTGLKVVAWISDTLQRPVSDVPGWKYLKRLGWTGQRLAHNIRLLPHPRHSKHKKLRDRIGETYWLLMLV